jgi:HAD superfamily hydrolase (TIGR01509 family)
MITHLLFDHDGVLVETEHWYFEATRQALASLGITMTFNDYKQHLVDGTSNWAEATRLGKSAQDIQAARIWRDARYQFYLQHENIDIPGVDDVLKQLLPHFQSAVITTSKRSDFELIHRDRPLLDNMAFVLCREDYTKPKPDPEPYAAGLKRFGIPAENAMVIEDSKRGLAAAEAAGIKTIKIHNEFVAHQNSTANYSLSSLRELPELLRKINQNHVLNSGLAK